MNSGTANLLGITAILCWCMNVAVTRHIAEAHPLGLPGLSFALSGLVLILADTLRRQPPPWRSDAGPRFWLLGGGAFVVYLMLYAAGLAWSPSRMAVLPLGLVNYLWPSLILVLMPLFFPCRLRPAMLTAGTLLCVAGAGCALLWGLSLSDIGQVAIRNWPAFVMMAAAAFLWAFYSNAARKWGNNANGTGWFLLAGGICFTLLWLAGGEPLGFDAATMLRPFLLHALVINAASYLFWDMAVRRGNIGLMGALANFLPVGSVFFGAWYLGEPVTTGLWLGSLLVAAGAILCRYGVSTR